MEEEVSCWGMTMIERAKEELEMLETHYPNRFGYLKTELKSFIDHHHHLLLLQSRNSAAVPPPQPSSSSATTQVSSSCRKRKKKDNGYNSKTGTSSAVDQDAVVLHKPKVVGRNDRVEVVIERARACIRKIQQFKTSL